MRIYKDYVLVSEITRKAKKAKSWVYTTKGIKIEYLGRIPIVKIEQLKQEYQEIARECHNLENLYPFSEFSREIGRTKDYMSVLANQREKANKKPFSTKKVGHARLLILSDEFIALVKQGYTPYKLSKKYDKDDYEHIIEMQDMKIGFY